MLKNRLRSGLIMGTAVLCAAFFLPPFSIGLLLIVLLCTVMGTREVYALLTSAGIPNFNVVGTICGALLVIVTWFGHRCSDLSSAGEWELFILFGITLVILTRLFPQKNNQQPLQTIGVTLLGVMYVPFLFNFLGKLLVAWGGVRDGRMLVLYMIVVVKFTDIGAYFTGLAFGKHKFWPRISPKKTWEGFAGGITTGLLVSVLFQVLSKGDLRVVTFTMADALILGVLLAVAGTMGDLMESLLKRAGGIKDSSAMIAGMGGVLDVLDSLLFTAPILYIYARLFLDGIP